MGDEEQKQKAIVEISDVFGLGKVANSKAIERLVGGIVDGIGGGIRSLISPWSMRRQSEAQIEVAGRALSVLPETVSLELDIGERTDIRLQRDASRFQLNRESISEIALENASVELRHTSPAITDATVITQDWLSAFWQKAELASDERMQILWSKVLLQEARRPGSLSKRSLGILSEMSVHEAKMVEALAPFVIEFERSNTQKLSAGILLNIGQYQGTFNVPNDVNRDYYDYVATLLPEFDIVALDAAGVMQSSTGWASEYSVQPKSEIHIAIGNSLFVITDLPTPNERYSERYYLGSGRGFTSEGCEISRIVNAKPNSDYVEQIRKVLRSVGCNLREVVE